MSSAIESRDIADTPRYPVLLLTPNNLRERALQSSGGASKADQKGKMSKIHENLAMENQPKNITEKMIKSEKHVFEKFHRNLPRTPLLNCSCSGLVL